MPVLMFAKIIATKKYQLWQIITSYDKSLVKLKIMCYFLKKEGGERKC